MEGRRIRSVSPRKYCAWRLANNLSFFEILDDNAGNIAEYEVIKELIRSHSNRTRLELRTSAKEFVDIEYFHYVSMVLSEHWNGEGPYKNGGSLQGFSSSTECPHKELV